MKNYNKITVGFVVQEYKEQKDGKAVCSHQYFVAGDEVSREDKIHDEPVEIDALKEVYQPFTMEQPFPIMPDEIDIFSSVWQNCEKEVIARNIVLISQKIGHWFGFTWELYKDLCHYDVTISEKHILADFVENDYLDYNEEDNTYKPNLKFMEAMKQYRIAEKK